MTGFRTLAPQKVYRVTIDANSTSPLVLQEGQPNKRINVIGLSLSASGAGTIQLKSNTTTKLPNEFKTADPSWVLPKSEDAWMECELGEDLRLTNSSGVTLNGVVVFVMIGDG